MNHLSAESGDAVSQLDGHTGDPSALLGTSESFFSSSNPNPERKIAFSATSATSGSAFLSGGPSQSSLDVGAPRVTDGIDADLNDPTWNLAPENDKSLVNNRLYADTPSSQNRPQSQRPHVPPQHHASIGGAIPTIPTEVLDFSQWDGSMAKTSPGVEHSFRSLEEVFGTVAHLGGTAGVSYDPFVPQSTDFPLWSAISVESEFIPIPSGDHDCGVPPQGFVDCHSLDVLFLGGDLGSAAGCKVSPSVEPHYPPSPSPNPAPSNPRKRRASTLCHEVKASSTPAPCPTPRPSKQKPQPKNTVASLEIIQYQPTDGILSKKRPAFDEIITGSSTPQTLRRISFEDGSGHIKATMTTFGKRVKTRTPFSNEKRQRTAMARKEGVCARCKRSKRQCDLAIQGLYDSCGLCKGSKLYKGALRMPCFRSTLVDILFFRAGPAANEPLFTRRNTVFSLEDLSAPDVPVRTLKLTQNIGSHQLTVYASQFDPHPEDVLTYKWRDSQGNPHIVEMPAFCLTNMEKVQAHFLQYIHLAKWSYLESLRKEDDFSWMTVSMSMDYARRNPDSLVANALDLWAVSRMIEIPWEMCGHDTLGVSRIEEPENPHHGKIPIPPIMDTQLDQIVIQNILTPLRTKIIRKFEALISPAKPEAWFDIYLAAFIMLNHIEKLAKHSVFHARLHGMRTKYSNATFLEGAFHTAKVILSRFHFVCNGSAPLRLDWRDGKTIEMARLEPNEVEFMKKTQVIVRERENDVISLRKTRKYEQTLYWCHQLYFEDWDKSPVHVIDE